MWIGNDFVGPGEAARLPNQRLRLLPRHACQRPADTAGESEHRIYELDAWRDTPFYSEKERAALAWAEAVTLVSDGHVPDSVLEQARSQFTEEELVNLTLAVVAIVAHVPARRSAHVARSPSAHASTATSRRWILEHRNRRTT
jgi:alkylhydroperoxidase family enzyme